MVIHKKSAAHEKKIVGKAEIEFRVIARRNRLLGDWAAEQLGFDGDAAGAYAKEVIAAGLERGGDEAVANKILTDFSEGSVAVTDAQLRAKITEFLEIAREEVESRPS